MIEVDLSLGGQIAPPSFQSLYLRLKFGDTQLASGTGFLVDTDTATVLVTARHNFTGRHAETDACLSAHAGVPDRVEIFHNGLIPGTNVAVSESLLNPDESPRWLEHPMFGNLCDVALLPLQNLSEVTVAPYSWARNYPNIAVQVAERVSVIGFPMRQSAGGMLAIWCTGYIASEPSQDYAGQPKFLVDCRTREGQSGSPVIAYRIGSYTTDGGTFRATGGPALRPLGVYTGRIHPDADIGTVWKWSVVEELMIEADRQFAKELRAAAEPVHH